MRQRKRTPFALVFRLGLGAALALVAAPASASTALSLKQPAALVIEGSSSVRSWKCEAKNPDIKASGQAGDLQVASGSVKVAVAKIDCNNGTMNNHLQNALKAKDFPSINFKLKRQEKGAASDNGVEMKLHGELTILDKSLPVVVVGLATPAEGGFRFVGKHELNMTQWGVEPPKLMLGTMKVGEMVTIGYDLQLEGAEKPQG